MSVNRRGALKMAGAAAVVLAAGGGAFILTRQPTRATAPWRAAGRVDSDPRLKALSYAILAPNPHNRQPWLVDLRTAGELTLYCDAERLLPVTDPESRQIVIGLGCFLELLRMAAAEDGYAADIAPFPEGVPAAHVGEKPIARVRFQRAAAVDKDPLFAHVLERRSNKEPYDRARQVGEAVLANLANAAGGRLAVETTNEPGRVADLRDLTWRAMETELTTRQAYMESVHLMRIGKAEIEASPDGIDLGGPFLETLSLLGMLSREALSDPATTAFRQGLDMFREITGSAMAFVWIKTGGNDRVTQLAVGRAWVRVNLKAAQLGLGIHPLSQALQEYAEVRPHFAAVHGMLAAGGGHRVQILGRLGYGPEVGPSPRWPIETRIMDI
ncbi:MAG: hypothetical protein QGI63_02405 [Rhodospirillales bacterium]|jgi:hypothetical protein|nr:hypothetical protein [Rhodospirillales bacterium]MDP6773099.1 hypothetical protein [Rhodospirillales bacterium]